MMVKRMAMRLGGLAAGVVGMILLSSSPAQAQMECVDNDGSVTPADVNTYADCVTGLDVTRERYTSFSVVWEYNRTTDDTDNSVAGDQPAPDVKEFLVRYQETANLATVGFDNTAGAKDIISEKVRRNSDPDDEDHEAMVTGLKPGKNYLVGVTSVPRSASDMNSGERLFQGEGTETDPATAPDDVLGLMLTPGDMMIMAEWDVATDNGSAVTGYEVQHREMGEDWPATPTRKGTTKDTSTMWTISNLKNGTEYEVRVRAYSYDETDDDIWSDVAMAIPGMTPTPALPLFGAFALGAGVLAAGRARLRRRAQRQLTR
jgi:hypothetical protein